MRSHDWVRAVTLHMTARVWWADVQAEKALLSPGIELENSCSTPSTKILILLAK